MFLVACASRTKALDKLIGTDVKSVLERWDEPVLVNTNDSEKTAYVFMQITYVAPHVDAQGSERQRATDSDLFWTYTCLTTDSTDVIKHWKAHRSQSQLDSSEIMDLFTRS
jgi:hypothetical protein